MASVYFVANSAEENVSTVPSRSRKLWKTALFLTGSGLLGGIALALWNRKELTEIQSKRDTQTAGEPHAKDEEDIY